MLHARSVASRKEKVHTRNSYTFHEACQYLGLTCPNVALGALTPSALLASAYKRYMRTHPWPCTPRAQSSPVCRDKDVTM